MREVASSSPKHVPPGEAQAACAIEVGFKPSNLPEIDSIIHHRRKPVSVSVPVEGCFYFPLLLHLLHLLVDFSRHANRCIR